MTTNKSLDDRHTKIIRQLLQEPENKKCMDCGTKGPVYVCSNFNTFICTACSGLHREFNHRVKSISMATFKPEEIKALQAGGNAVARKKWMSKWTHEDFPEPDPADATRVKAFMKLKYIDKRWYSETGEGPTPYVPHHPVARRESAGASSIKKIDSYPQPESLTKILGNNIPPIEVNNKPAPAHTSTSHSAPPTVQSHPPSNPSNQNSLVDWNPTPAATKSASDDLNDLLSIPPAAQQQYQQQLQMQQQQNLYQQQQQLIMQQFQQPWGAQPQTSFYGAPNPYGSQFPGQQFPGGQFAQVPPANFFTPPAGQAQTGNGAISPVFGQSGGFSTAPSPSPSQAQQSFGGGFGQQPGAFGQQPGGFGQQPGAGFGQQPGGFGQQPGGFGQQNSFTQGSPALVPQPGGFGQPPAQAQQNFGQAPQPQPPAPAPVPEKPDIFAALSPLSAGNLLPTKAASTGRPGLSPALSSTSVSHASSPSLNSMSTPTPPAPSSNSASTHNPFNDPFGGMLSPSPAAQSQPSHSQPAQNGDPFGFGSSAPAQHAQQSHANGDPFGFGNSTSHSQPAQSAQANPFGANPFGGQPAPATNHQSSQMSSAFTPFASPPQANPFGGQPQPQAVHANNDWNANPFF